MVSDVLVSSISDSECRLKVTKSVAYAAFVHAAIKSMLIIVLVFIRIRVAILLSYVSVEGTNLGGSTFGIEILILHPSCRRFP